MSSELETKETGTTANRGISIDSSDSEYGLLKVKKVSHMNEDQMLSKVSEESCRGRYDSEGDADEEIIDGDDDEGVDPNAYGDEDETETEAKEAAAEGTELETETVDSRPHREEKKEYFKRKPTAPIIEEVFREKKPAVPRAPWR